MSLYKYLPKKYLSSLMDEGVVLFRELNFFKKYDSDKSVRLDENEGGIYHKVPGKPHRFLINEKDYSQYIVEDSFKINYSLPSNKKAMIYCLSRNLSLSLFKEFCECDKTKIDDYCCVEIENETEFIEAVRIKLDELFSKVKLYHQDIIYFDAN